MIVGAGADGLGGWLDRGCIRTVAAHLLYSVARASRVDSGGKRFGGDTAGDPWMARFLMMGA